MQQFHPPHMTRCHQLFIIGNTYINPITNDNGLFATILASALQIHGSHVNASITGPGTVVTVPLGRQLVTSLSLITGSHA